MDLETHVIYCQLSLESMDPPKPHRVLVLILTDGIHKSQISFSCQFFTPNPFVLAPIPVGTKLHHSPWISHFKLDDLPRTTTRLSPVGYRATGVFAHFQAGNGKSRKGQQNSWAPLLVTQNHRMFLSLFKVIVWASSKGSPVVCKYTKLPPPQNLRMAVPLCLGCPSSTAVSFLLPLPSSCCSNITLSEMHPLTTLSKILNLAILSPLP